MAKIDDEIEQALAKPDVKCKAVLELVASSSPEELEAIISQLKKRIQMLRCKQVVPGDVITVPFGKQRTPIQVEVWAVTMDGVICRGLRGAMIGKRSQHTVGYEKIIEVMK